MKIKKAQIQSLKIEDDQEETNSWWYSVIAVIAVLLVSVILLLLGKLHKKNILLEETRKVDAHCKKNRIDSFTCFCRFSSDIGINFSL